MKPAQDLIIKLKQEMDRIANLIKHQHHKSRDGVIEIIYNAFDNKWIISYAGYYYKTFEVASKDLNIALALSIAKLQKFKKAYDE